MPAISHHEKQTVLLVENNPLDRAVVDELLADTEFQVRYTKSGRSVHEPWRDLEKLLADDLSGQEYPIVLFDLGLSRATESLLADEDVQQFLADSDRLWELWEQRTTAGQVGDEVAKRAFGIDPVAYLLGAMWEMPDRLYGVISHFVRPSIERTMKALVAGDRNLASGSPADLEKVEAWRQVIANLVFNKADLRGLVEALRKALPSRSPKARFKKAANWPTVYVRDLEGPTSFGIRVRQIIRKHPLRSEKDPRVYIVDAAGVLRLWTAGTWKEAFAGFFHQGASPAYCTTWEELAEATRRGWEVILRLEDDKFNLCHHLGRLRDLKRRAVIYCPCSAELCDDVRRPFLQDAFKDPAVVDGENAILLVPTNWAPDPEFWAQTLQDLAPSADKWKRKTRDSDWEKWARQLVSRKASVDYEDLKEALTRLSKKEGWKPRNLERYLADEAGTSPTKPKSARRVLGGG